MKRQIFHATLHCLTRGFALFNYHYFATMQLLQKRCTMVFYQVLSFNILKKKFRLAKICYTLNSRFILLYPQKCQKTISEHVISLLCQNKWQYHTTTKSCMVIHEKQHGKIACVNVNKMTSWPENSSKHSILARNQLTFQQKNLC